MLLNYVFVCFEITRLVTEVFLDAGGLANRIPVLRYFFEFNQSAVFLDPTVAATRAFVTDISSKDGATPFPWMDSISRVEDKILYTMDSTWSSPRVVGAGSFAM